MMRLIMHIFKYEWLGFSRNRFQLLMMTLVFLLGCYSIYYGQREMRRQQAAIDMVSHEVALERAELLKGFEADTMTTEGKKAWQRSAVTRFSWTKQSYAVSFAPNAFSALSLGQRDLQPYYYKLTAMSVFYQLFQNEIANPQQLATGNFDLSFVLVYLFPLLIIALCYGLLSNDKDLGMLTLLKSQSAPAHLVVSYRFLFYTGLVSILAILLCLFGFLYNGVGLINELQRVFFFLISVMAYLFFWFAMIWLLVSFNWRSTFNAMTAISLWMVFLIAMPAALNIWISIKMPLNSSVLSGISRRTGVFDEENDDNQKKVISEYLVLHPELNSKAVYSSNLAAKGFAAYTAMNDGKSAIQVRTYQHRVSSRERLARSFDVLNPAANLQTLLDHLAGDDLHAFTDFNGQVQDFHSNLVAFYYPRLFKDLNLSLADLKGAPIFKLQQPVRDNAMMYRGLAYLFIVAMLMFFYGLKNLKAKI
jgi:ABC-2 type transport system permease protein